MDSHGFPYIDDASSQCKSDHPYVPSTSDSDIPKSFIAWDDPKSPKLRHEGDPESQGGKPSRASQESLYKQQSLDETSLGSYNESIQTDYDFFARQQQGSLSGKTQADKLHSHMYNARKTIAAALLNVALLGHSACQLKHVIEVRSYPLRTLAILFLSVSIVLQIFLGTVLVSLGRTEMGSWRQTHQIKHGRLTVAFNNVATFGAFLVTVLNLFIVAFVSYKEA